MSSYTERQMVLVQPAISGQTTHVTPIPAAGLLGYNKPLHKLLFQVYCVSQAYTEDQRGYLALWRTNYLMLDFLYPLSDGLKSPRNCEPKSPPLPFSGFSQEFCQSKQKNS